MKTKIVAKNFPVVCVGGSAGGLDSYIRLLKNFPVDMGVAIVIVNHLRKVATLLHDILPFRKSPKLQDNLICMKVQLIAVASISLFHLSKSLTKL